MSACKLADRQRAAAALARDLAYDLRDHFGISHAYHACALCFDGGAVTEAGSGRDRVAVVTGRAYATSWFLVGEIRRRDGWAAFVTAGVRYDDGSTPEADRDEWEVFFVEEPEADDAR